MGTKPMPPPTCTGCMGRGKIAETKTVHGADEKGLPTKDTITAIVPCGECGGKGTK